MPAAELASRKKALVQELNSYIAMKKDRSGDLEARKELALTTRNSSPEKAYAGTTDAIKAVKPLSPKSVSPVHRWSVHVTPLRAAHSGTWCKVLQ